MQLDEKPHAKTQRIFFEGGLSSVIRWLLGKSVTLPGLMVFSFFLAALRLCKRPFFGVVHHSHNIQMKTALGGLRRGLLFL